MLCVLLGPTPNCAKTCRRPAIMSRVPGQRKCWSVLIRLAADDNEPDATRAPTFSGFSGSRYFLTVFLLMPSSLAMPRVDTPLSLA